MKLCKMTPSEYEIFRERSQSDYARERRVLTEQTEDEAMARASTEFARILPEGQATPDHFFYSLHDESGGHCGYIWFALNSSTGKQRIFVMDIMVEPSHRRKGYGQFMLQWLKDETRRLGYNEIALHVLAHNHGARQLYEQMGFEVTNLYMSLKVAP